MLSFLKRVVVRYLERSDDPELRKYAALINDAPKELADFVLDIITGDLRTHGKITRKTEILAARTKFLNPSAKEQDTVASSVSPYLEEYLDLFRSIARIASWRKAIYLQGFPHSPDCSSLWLFHEGVTPSFRLAETSNKRYEITYSATELKIFLFQKMTEKVFREKNKAIGVNYSEWRNTVVEASMDKVFGVFEDYVELQRTVVTEKKGRRGGTTQHEATELHSYPITDRNGGVDAIIESLPIAIEERDSSLAALRKRQGQ